MNRETAAARPRRAIFLASMGGALEFYDFILYGIFAAYLGPAFFPSDDPLVSLGNSFAAFAGGYLARPVGGLVFGHFGDRIGRRRILIASIFLMSISTMAMGLMPTYATIGIYATIGMVLLRLIQGFAVGGELPAAITYAAEISPRRGLACGIVIMFVNSGVIFAALISLLLHSLLPPEDMAQWGWRLGFILGGVLGLVSFWLRLSLEETQAFGTLRQERPRIPLVELLRLHPRRLILGVAALSIMAGFNGLLFAHMPSYLSQVLNYPPFDAAAAQNIALIALSAALLGAAWASDHMRRTHLLGFGALLFIVLAWPFYTALSAHSGYYPLLMVGAALVASLGNGTFAAILADLFPAHLRLTGIAACLNLSTTLLSGTAPLLATALIAATGFYQAPALMLIACGIVALAAAMGINRLPPADRDGIAAGAAAPSPCTSSLGNI